MAERVAEAFLSSFFQMIFDRLASSNFTDYFCRGKLGKLVEELESTLESINQVLDDAEKKQYQIPNVKKWLGDVRHAMYEADQLLDEISTDASLKKLKVESQPTTSNNFFGYVSAFINPFESRIKELLKNLRHFAEQKDVLELKNEASAHNEVGAGSKLLERQPTSFLVDASEIYGRDDDKYKMINILLSNNGSGNKTPVTSIVGMGGIGKTTFAKLVYNDSKIEDHFELRAWVYVSESFDVVGLTKAILKSFNSPADDESIFNLLQLRLHHILTGKKYLLVLDDIWNRNVDFWEQLLLPFNHGTSESKIIVTTRNKEVANVLKSTKLFDLRQLGTSDCWSLFVTHAFHGKSVCEYPNLESIGKKVVDKCGGLPLAIKTLGQLLRKRFTELEWMKILETDMWRLSDDDININPVLRLSYHNLPSNQKRCFAYCSIFPKGRRFGKDELIMFWMAEGLLKCNRTDKSEEELGNEIFGDLESISFFQPSPYLEGLGNEIFGALESISFFPPSPYLEGTRMESNLERRRRFKRYQHKFVMHDLVNDLAKSVSGEFSRQIEGARVEGIHERTRHICCSSQLIRVDELIKPICEHKGLRSLILEGHIINVQSDLFSRLKWLRMLSFRYCSLSELADEISNLKLLRYLDLSYTEITRLPDTICMLYHLQTLLLRDCCELTELPSNFSELVNLRHLELPLKLERPCIKKMPKDIGNLNNLQTLTYFTMEEQNGSDLQELAKLNNLHGKIHIKGLGNVIDPADAATTTLKNKKYLKEIQMTFDGEREEMDGSIVESSVSVLETLRPNRNLKRLTIEYYEGIMFSTWLNGFHLPNLVSLKLQHCGLCSHLPSLGQLPFLKKLSIRCCDGIKIIGEEFYDNNSTNVSFKSLEVLEFSGMLEWEEWFCLEAFPFLKNLSIKDCPKLKKALPQHLPSLQKLEIFNCLELEVSIPKADNLTELDLKGCGRILLNELPSSLKKSVLRGNRYVEELELDLGLYNSLPTLSLNGWHFSSLPCSPHLFTNLHSLKLFDCTELESFPTGGLPSNLRCLEIHNCSKLISSREAWDLLFQLYSLKVIRISDEFENMESFPEENLLPPSLESLYVNNCSKLRRINYKGFLHLKSLKSLFISNCPYLEHLPEEGLPKSLSYLEIHNCPLLKEKYQKDEGERWHTIRHIHLVFIH